MIVKIKRVADNKYSTGGHLPSFTKKGKMWSSVNYVKAHLRNLYKSDAYDVYKDCYIVEIDDNNSYIEKYIEMKDFLDDYYASEVIKNKQKEIEKLKFSIKHSQKLIEKETIKLEHLKAELEGYS